MAKTNAVTKQTVADARNNRILRDAAIKRPTTEGTGVAWNPQTQRLEVQYDD